ncbi:hypothetical protein Tco_1255572 [Tanacetum coccineum]
MATKLIDEIIAKDQPYADYASTAALSLGYVADSDPEEDLEEDPEEILRMEEERAHLLPATPVIAPTLIPVPSYQMNKADREDESRRHHHNHHCIFTTTKDVYPSLAPMPFHIRRDRVWLEQVKQNSTAAVRPIGGHRADYEFKGTIDAKIRRQKAKECRLWLRMYLEEETQEALPSREAWAYSVSLSSAVHYELQAYKTHIQIQDYRIASQESLTATLELHRISNFYKGIVASSDNLHGISRLRDYTHEE